MVVMLDNIHHIAWNPSYQSIHKQRSLALYTNRRPALIAPELTHTYAMANMLYFHLSPTD